ncbi:hypothetical protein N7540_007363 [Penicillium herquei]|nr:hypothetical protein N7540_007363 [Penicillium herquei]
MADAHLAPPPPPQNVQPGDYLVVVHGHVGGDDEIQMKCNQLIRLVELDDEFGDGWWLGEHADTNQRGLFPAGFTRKAKRHEYQQYVNALRIDSGQGIYSSEKTESPAQIEPTTPKDRGFGAGESQQTTPQASRQNSIPEVSRVMDSPAQQRSASSPLPQSTLAADIQNALRPSGSHHVNGEESPVMNETLSVIDEHITDMNTPRHSLSTQDAKTINDSGSEYSSHISHRLSYINGHETDEEEGEALTEEDVRRWNQIETANHLRSLGVDHKHCDIFENEEITGEVLLEMNQDFLFMKEFDFGVMGKRLKTWHKIKAFQEEVGGAIQPQRQLSQHNRGTIAGYPSPHDERSMSRASQAHPGPFLPRIPTVSEKTGAGYSRAASMGPGQHPRLASNGSSPITPMTPPRYPAPDSRRLSAASIRDLNHSRRHSSIDTTQRGVPEFYGHQKKPSFDRSWTLNGGTVGLPSRPGTSVGTPSEGYRAFRGTTESEPNTPEGFDDLDRGYFSGTEVDTRRTRRLQKRNASNSGSIGHHSRKSSYHEEPPLPQPPKRQSRIGSVDSLRDDGKHVSTASKIYNDSPAAKSRLRSLSQRSSGPVGRTSTSSNTDTKSGFFASLAPKKKGGDADSSARASHFQPLRNVGPKMRRAVGMRAISDAATKDSSAPASPRESEGNVARTGSTTPSGTSKSSERHSTDGSGKAGEAPGFVVRPRTVKSKKDTSAYTQGLEKKSPLEQMGGCDYSGWMKKRSSNLMTTWKPRLFVLRGRRLSYYYTEDDTEERGLIDITAHRVLRADNDPIVALHATVTGSTAQPANAGSTEQGGAKSASSPSGSESTKSKEPSGPFFFKLVPPKSGNSRTVQFTKPTTHYFQVDNVKEGRLWMAALMKATIERDLDQIAVTTNKQKTISLKQAQLMQQRPPALMGNPRHLESEKLVEEDEEDEGLRIEGLNLTKSGSSEGNSFVDVKGELSGAAQASPITPDESNANPLGEINMGPTSLLPSPLAKNA